MSKIPLCAAALRAAVIPILALALTSCYDTKEIDHMFYVHAVGIDYVDGQYEVYTQMANFNKMVGGTEAGGSSGTAPAVKIGKQRGDTLAMTIHDMYTYAQRRLYWGHISHMVLSQSVLKDHAREVADLFGRFHELRYTTWVFAAAGPIMDILTTLPVLEESAIFSRLGDPYEVYEQSSIVHPIRLNQFVRELYEPGRSVVIPLVSIESNAWFAGGRMNPSVKIDGAAILRQESLGIVRGEAFRGLRWMQETTMRTPLIVYSEEGDPAATLILTRPKVRISPVMSGQRPQFSIQVKLRGRVLDLLKPVSAEFLKEEAEKLIQSEIRQTYWTALEQNNSDVYQLSNKLYKKDPQRWRREAPGGEFKLETDTLADIAVEVHLDNSYANKLITPGLG